MVIPAAGSIVLVPFPFSDLSQSKLQPAVVLADAGKGDWILGQITSKPYSDTRAVLIEERDFTIGSLQHPSYVRPGKLFTANQALMVAEVGKLQEASFHRVLEAVTTLLNASRA